MEDYIYGCLKHKTFFFTLATEGARFFLFLKAKDERNMLVRITTLVAIGACSSVAVYSGRMCRYLVEPLLLY